MGLPKLIATFDYDDALFSTLDKMLAFGEKMAGNAMEEHGEVPPIWFLMTGDKVVAMLTPWGGERDKAISIGLLRQMIIDFNISRYVFFAETWIANVTPDTPKELAEEMPMHRPDRREAVMVHAFERDNPENRCVMLDIVRADKAKPKLAKSEFMKDGGYFEGRMFNLFVDQPIPN